MQRYTDRSWDSRFHRLFQSKTCSFQASL